jgi:hypothetical protein
MVAPPATPDVLGRSAGRSSCWWTTPARWRGRSGRPPTGQSKSSSPT